MSDVTELELLEKQLVLLDQVSGMTLRRMRERLHALRKSGFEIPLSPMPPWLKGRWDQLLSYQKELTNPRAPFISNVSALRSAVGLVQAMLVRFPDEQCAIANAHDGMVSVVWEQPKHLSCLISSGGIPWPGIDCTLYYADPVTGEPSSEDFYLVHRLLDRISALRSKG